MEKYHRAVLCVMARQKRRKILWFLRKQHKEQKVIDDKATEEDPNVETNFCKLCGLNFNQPKSVHFNSFFHKVIRIYF